MSNSPIGFFDSGVGGLSIWKEVHCLLPNEHSIYLADSANAPYGYHTEEEIIALCIKNTEFLIARGCKLIVVACNTATTNAIAHLRAVFDVPFIGIEPAIKPAAIATKTNVVGILATKGTLASSLFHKTASLYGDGVTVVERVGEGLVPLVESGKECSDEAKKLLTLYLEPMIVKKIDYLVLGCTHYPFLMPLLRELLPENITVIASGGAVARQTRTILQKKGLEVSCEPRSVSSQFYTNADNVDVVKHFLSDCQGISVEKIDF